MALTNFSALSTEQLTVWSRDLWKAARNKQFLSAFVGSNSDAMIERITELTPSEKGARAVITLVADLEGDGVAGDRTLEGNEEQIKSFDQVINLDMLRHANRHEGRMAEQKSVVKFRETSKDVLSYWMADRLDQLAFLTLSGVSYSYHPTGSVRVGSDLINLDFAAGVSAPTTNRHRRWSSSSGLLAGATNAVAATDTPSWAMLVELKAYANNNYLKPIRTEDGVEHFNCFMTPSGIAKLKRDPDFLNILKDAGDKGKASVLFKGTRAGMNALMADGIAIHEYRHVYSTRNAPSGSKWGGAGTVDGQRVLFCGAQALGYADIGEPTWVEKRFDYDNQERISAGKIFGFLKPRFRSALTGTTEDFGVIVCDTAL